VEVTFRRLSDDDLRMLHGWLNEPGVVRWWEGEDVTWDAVEREYGTANPDPVEHWIASVDGHDVGWIQCWAAADEPEEVEPWRQLGVTDSAAGIDYLLGNPGERGRGLGTEMIRTFVRDIVFGLNPHYTQACASPYAANTASWRALEKAGFRYAGTFDDDEGPCRLMIADRPT
jgi:aminoglycoside 6'-N-acetyltransferase